jgi:predicted nucleotide-binding protein
LAERYDVFICHAHEDKEQVVRPLAEALRSRNLRVWYDEFELRIGDSLTQSIEKGLSESDFAVVVLSPSFFNKSWPQKELDALAAGERQKGVPRILPVWHDVTASEVRKQNPVLADRLAIETDEGLEQVAGEVTRAVWAKRDSPKPRCAILASFSPDAQKIVPILTNALYRVGVEVVTPSHGGSKGATWLEDIRAAIKRVDFVVADVTDSNPNVLIEVGIAYAVDKPVILLVNSRTQTRLPSDLAGYIYLAYDPHSLSELSSEFERVARRYADTQGVR